MAGAWSERHPGQRVRPGLAPYEHDEGSVDEAHGGVGLAGNDGDAYRLFLEVFARGHDDGEEKTLSVRAGGLASV